MAFIVEDGTGLPDSTSFQSVAGARAYWSDVGVTFSQVDTVLESALNQSTRYIARVNKCRWKGVILVSSPVKQALPFPRGGVYDADGILQDDVVPKDVADATSEYMRRIVDGLTDLQPDPTRDPAVTKIREKVGPIETENEFIPGSLTRIQPYPSADALLKPYVYGSSGGCAVR